MGKTEEDWNRDWNYGFLKTVQPQSFSKLTGAVCNFKNYTQETFVCLGSLILSVTCNFFAYFKFHSDWRRLIGKIKQNKLDCRDTAPLKFVFCVAHFLSMTWSPRTLQFHNKTKKHANNTNTEIWQCVDHTTIPEPVAKNQGNMIQDTVNE